MQISKVKTNSRPVHSLLSRTRELSLGSRAGEARLWDCTIHDKGKRSNSSLFYNLQSIGKGLVELGDLGRDAEVDGAVADLQDEAADDVGVDLSQTLIGCYDRWERVTAYLSNDLELLALAELVLGNGLLKAVDGLVVEFLRARLVSGKSSETEKQWPKRTWALVMVTSISPR